jgi:hypothetical protein
MKKPAVLAALSAFALIGAAYPATPRLDYVIDLDGGGATATAAPATSWRPCRRDRRDDRCIQLYERGVRHAYAEWRRDHGVAGTRMATRHHHRAHRQQLALAARCAEPASASAAPAPRHEAGASINGM